MSFVATGLVWQWMLTPGIGIENAVRQMGFPNFEFDWDHRSRQSHIHHRHCHRVANPGLGDGDDARGLARHR